MSLDIKVHNLNNLFTLNHIDDDYFMWENGVLLICVEIILIIKRIE